MHLYVFVCDREKDRKTDLTFTVSIGPVVPRSTRTSMSTHNTCTFLVITTGTAGAVVKAGH